MTRCALCNCKYINLSTSRSSGVKNLNVEDLGSVSFCQDPCYKILLDKKFVISKDEKLYPTSEFIESILGNLKEEISRYHKKIKRTETQISRYRMLELSINDTSR